MFRALGSFAITSVALGALFSCSDPVDPPPQAGLFLTYRTLVGSPCPHAATQPQEIPLGAATALQTTGGGDDVRVADGKGASVGCSVKATADGFQVRAALNSGGAEFDIRGSLRGTGPNQPMDIGSQPPVQGGQRQDGLRDPACPVNIEYVASGAIFGHFDCTGLANANSGITCGSRGDFVFENCAD